MSLSIDAAVPPPSGSPDAPKPPASLSAAADFAAALRDYTELDETHARRFARINATLRGSRPAYRDRDGCRSWLVW